MPFRPSAAILAALLLLGCDGRRQTADQPVRAAVASNFVKAFEEIAARFTATTGIEVSVSPASTGKLYAQIVHGAPFDLLLAADQARPERLVAEGLAAESSRLTYARGRLALFGRGVDPEDGAATLRTAAFQNLAVANPKTAPYGLAAAQALDALDLRDLLADRLVMGENIGQTMHFVDSGGADLGLVALSQVAHRRDAPTWIVPESLHEPIRQDAVLLGSAAERPQAAALLEFLRGPEARAVLARYGYLPGEE